MARLFLIALQFMTVFRLSDDLKETEEDLAASAAFYPLVGLVLGLCLAGAAAVFHYFLPPAVVALLTALFLAALTQGLHLDGLADTADGLLSHRDRARKLEIMKDSAVGGMGAIALVFIIGLKVILLAGLPWPEAWPMMVLFPLWGRWAASLTMSLSGYARAEGGLGRPFIEMAGRREIVRAGAVTLVFSLILAGPEGVVIALIVALASLIGVRLWERQLGGVTGDILGAVIELGECLGLMAAAAWL